MWHRPLADDLGNFIGGATDATQETRHLNPHAIE
jgi:hypothetical protein